MPLGSEEESADRDFSYPLGFHDRGDKSKTHTGKSKKQNNKDKIRGILDKIK